MHLELENGDVHAMLKESNGYFSIEVDAVSPGDLYSYRLENGLKRPDPVSRSLPRGVHGPTQIIDPNSFTWHDQQWEGIRLADAVIYELHIGTFTPEGTFEAVIDKLDYLLDLGVNMIEIMPVAQFPGKWNWGYDGVALYAPAHSYGGAKGLRYLIDACHQKGMAVCLDVVYNHLGPEGNYLGEFGYYFHERYHTPWGQAFNYDGAYSDDVRHYIIQNALYWAREYHIDALRLDAVHGIYDFSAEHVLPELASQIDIPLIAECDLNDSKVVRPIKEGGWGLAAVWNDDFHHALHTAVSGEQHVYYQDFDGLPDLAKAVSDGFVYDGCYSHFRKKKHGTPADEVPYNCFLAYSQNHDQIGNRPFGERLHTLVSPQRKQAAACLGLLSPFIPMLFMGEEYGEKAPFEYFVDYSDEQLMRAIYEGRQREFHCENMPFPGKESFTQSKLTWEQDKTLLTLYKKLIAIRKAYSPKEGLAIGEALTYVDTDWIAWEYPTEKGPWLGIFCYLGQGKKELVLPFEHVENRELLLSTQEISLSSTIYFTLETALVVV